MNQDKLFINLTKAVRLGYFISIEGIDLRQKDHIMTNNIKKQMVDSAFNQNFASTIDSAGSGSKGLLIGTLLLNFVFAGAFAYMV